MAILFASSMDVFPQAVRKIAFTHGGTATASSIAVINEDGTGLVLLTNGGSDRDPSWSPDGTQIVYMGTRFHGNNIIRMNADGTGQVPLTDSVFPFGNGEPAWSPDGTKIAFTSNRAEVRRNEIWVMNADGTNPVRLTVNVQLGSDSSGPFYGLDASPAWSPDGKKIVFWSTRDGFADSELYSMNADGSNQVRLTDNTAEDKDPVWSRDGKRIVFSSFGGGRNGIYEINADGTNDHRITDGFAPDVSPDGGKLALTDFDPAAGFAFAIYLVDPDGIDRVKLTSTGSVNSWLPAWQTTGGPAPPPPPPPPVYTVSGRVIDTSIAQAGPGVPGVTITLTGASSGSVITDANGFFSFGNLPENSNFTLTPSNPNYRFFPTILTFSTSPPLLNFIGKNLNVQFDAAPIVLQFLSATFAGTEGTSAFVTVERFGATQGTSTIQYSTSNGTAAAGADYVETSGTLTFNPGDQLKSFLVPLIYDKLVEPDETINLTLTNATGGIQRGRQTAVLTIFDSFPRLLSQLNSNLAAAVNAQTFVRDPFPLTTTFLNQTGPTQLALFATFVDLLPGEDLTVVTVTAFEPNQVAHDLPVEFVGKVPGIDDLTQINVRLPGDLPVGDFSLSMRLRGRGSNRVLLRIK